MAAVSCCRCTAAAAVADCYGPVAGRNRARTPDVAGNDADDGVAAVDVAAGVVVAVGAAAAVDDDDAGGAGGVGGGRRWSPCLNSGNHLRHRRTPRRMANRPLLDAVGVRGAAGPQWPNRTREPFLPFRYATGHSKSCTLLIKE